MKALKKLLVAVIALSPLATFAQEAAKPAEPPKPPPMAQVYGTLNVNLQYTGAEGATNTAQNVKPRFGIGLDSSNIGVKGMTDLTETVKAVYQCETGAQIDGEGVVGICNRNSRVGLQGAFGTVFYGNWDTPYKNGTYGTNADDPFGNTDVYGHASLMGSPGYGVRSGAIGNAAGTSAGFDMRAGNSLAYWSPKFGPVSFKLQGSMDEFANAAGTVRPFLVAGALNLDMGGLSVVGQFDYRADYFGIRTMSGANAGNAASKDMALRLAAGYTIPMADGMSLNLVAWLESIGYTQDGATDGFKSYGRAAALLGAKFKMGDHEFRARYSMAGNPSIKAFDGGTLAAGAEDNLGATNIVVGYGYNMAKTTQLYAYYSLIQNEDRARYTFGVGGTASVVGANTPAGSDPSALGVGIRHSF